MPTFAVDEGFWYASPEELKIGSLVRIPLGGRRVRGYVVELSERPPRSDLRASGPEVMKLPIFDRPLLDALIWSAHRYVAPIPVMLERATPPNLANRLGADPLAITMASSGQALSEYARSVAAGLRRPPVAYVARSGDFDWLTDVAAPVLGAGASLMVVAATGAEVDTLVSSVAPKLAQQTVVVKPESKDAEVTAAWVRCQAPGNLLIGTPRITPWSVAGLAMAVAVEEGRRAMKERQTPTIAVRDFLRTRASLAGNGLIFVGPTPSLETVASGATVIRSRPAPGHRSRSSIATGNRIPRVWWGYLRWRP